MIARDQLRSVIDRILRLKEEQDVIAEDIREVYSEAKSNGYDKTALGRVVAHLRKVAKTGAAGVAEADTIFDLYLTAYEGPSHTHAHAREDDTSCETCPPPIPSGPADSGSGQAEQGGRGVSEPPAISRAPTPSNDDWPEMPAALRRF